MLAIIELYAGRSPQLQISLCVIAVSYVMLGATNFALSIVAVFAIRSFRMQGATAPLRTNADVRLFGKSLNCISVNLKVTMLHLAHSVAALLSVSLCALRRLVAGRVLYHRVR